MIRLGVKSISEYKIITTRLPSLRHCTDLIAINNHICPFLSSLFLVFFFSVYQLYNLSVGVISLKVHYVVLVFPRYLIVNIPSSLQLRKVHELLSTVIFRKILRMWLSFYEVPVIILNIKKTQK